MFQTLCNIFGNQKKKIDLSFLFFHLLRSYFAIVQKDATLEVWDMQTLNLLWTLAKKFTGITALVGLY